jgi:hypothetical protein
MIIWATKIYPNIPSELLVLYLGHSSTLVVHDQQPKNGEDGMSTGNPRLLHSFLYKFDEIEIEIAKGKRLGPLRTKQEETESQC